MASRTRTARWVGVCLAASALSVLSGCGPKNETPPPPPKQASPEDRIRLVGKAWREMTQTEAYLQDRDVAWMRATDQFTLHLGQGGVSAIVDFERTELMRTPFGTEYHCTVAGSVQAALKYEWRMGEAVLTVRAPQAVLKRRCKEPGFPIATKKSPALDVTYALRGDRLVAIDPPTIRSSLLPVD
jgi:hypothetical protein